MKKVFMIEDDPDILEATTLLLTMRGFKVEGATRSSGAYGEIQQYEPDVLIIDLLLSGDDGRDICTYLKQQQDTKDIPIIMISAHPNAADATANCGADAFVAKPYSSNELLDKITEVTKQKSLA